MYEQIFNLLFILLKKTPDKLTFFFSKLICNFIYTISKFTKYKNFLENNIKNTLKTSEINSKKIAKRTIILLIQNIVNFVKFEKLTEDKIKKIVSIKNIENYYKAKERNKGIIFVSAHYGFWELIGAYISIVLKENLSVFVQRPSEKFIDNLFYKLRKSLNIETLYTDNYISSFKKMINKLDNKNCLGFLVDQHGENEKYFVEFFNKFVSAPEISVNLAYRKDVPILPVFIKRIDKNKHEIKFYEPIFIDYSKNKDRVITDTLQNIYNIIENTIKQKPDEYLWFYERFNKLSSQSIEIALNLELLKKEKLK